MKQITQQQVDFLVEYIKGSVIPSRDGFAIVSMLHNLPPAPEAAAKIANEPKK